MSYGPLVEAICRTHQIAVPQAEYRFHPTRKWRLDFAWPSQRVAMEIDGGAFIGGRHMRGTGWLKDAEKRRELAAMGWKLLPVAPREVRTGVWVVPLMRALTSDSTERMGG